MEESYKVADELFNSGNYLQAFEVFKEITQNEFSSQEDKSDAYNMMGAIVLIDTRVESTDESGIEYFIKSLEFNPRNIGALLNIIDGFGLSINNHRDIKILDSAIQTLRDLNYSLTENEVRMIDNRLTLKELLMKENSR